jgi:HPt (histidine-containing phosphotransfer) domain-containing protein
VSEDAFERKMIELGAAFRAELPMRIAEIESLAAGGPESLPALRAIAHRIAGRGGTFGAPAVSAAARAVEEAEPAELARAVAALAAAAREAA